MGKGMNGIWQWPEKGSSMAKLKQTCRKTKVPKRKIQNTCRQKHDWYFEVGLERGVVWQELNRQAEKQNN